MPSETTLLRSPLELVDEPDEMIPLLPGESIHLGYIPIDEDAAFRHELLPHQISITHFRMPRGKITFERLSSLIHKFISINLAVDVLVPKREWVNDVVKRLIYQTKVVHTWRSHSAIIVVRVLALASTDEIVVNVDRFQGSVTAHRMFFHTLEQYVLSDGRAYPLIRPVSVNREELAAASPPQKWAWPEIVAEDQSTPLLLTGSIVYGESQEEEDDSDEEEEDPYTPNGGTWTQRYTPTSSP